MAGVSRRQAAVLGLAVSVSGALITLVIGPRYLEPLPIWAKLIVAVACGCFIAAVAVWARIRARQA